MPVASEIRDEEPGREQRGERALLSSELITVGIAAPGQLDRAEGRVLHYRLLEDFDQVPLAERFREAFDVPVFIEDNIRAATYAELLRGHGRGLRHFLCLAVRSGVGMGIVIDGELYRGSGDAAGEAGHLVFPTADGPRLAVDLVSATGFVETTVKRLRARQATAARRRILDRDDEPTLAEIVALADAGDELVLSRLVQLGEHLGKLAANLANLFAPEKILLTGEVPNCSAVVRQTMERVFRLYALLQVLKRAYRGRRARAVWRRPGGRLARIRPALPGRRRRRGAEPPPRASDERQGFDLWSQSMKIFLDSARLDEIACDLEQ